MNTPPRISVVLPARNAARSLPAALDSLFRQTLRDIEIIVLDDGSDDDGATRRVIETYAACDRRLRPGFLPRRGIAATLNSGLAPARADIVARMDADDVSLPARLELQADLLDDHPEVAVAGCLVAHGGDRVRNAGYARHVSWANSLTRHEEIALGLFRDSPLPHPSVAFRKNAVLEHGGYRLGDFPEDYELWLRLATGGARFAKVPETLLVWNDPRGRLSRTDARYAPEKFAAVKAPHLARWLSRHNPHHPEIIVAGAGRITRKRAEFLTACGVCIKAYLDVDPDKIGRIVHGRPVLHRDEVPGPEKCFVASYLSGVGAAADVSAFLESRGFKRAASYLLAG
ncbi:MAG: glycosyltransferase [Desulfovibrionaceae bacterium]|nr:glycosyltransferase [Desulfovibrionaceae bacterium]